MSVFSLSFFGFSVDVVSVVAVSVVAVSLLVVVAVVSVVSAGGGRRTGRVRGGGACVVVVTTVVVIVGRGCGGGGTFTVLDARGTGAGAAVAGGIPLAIEPDCCCGITPPAAGPPGMFAGGSAVPSANVPVVSVFVAVAGGWVSPGALIVDVALPLCPSCTTSYCG